MFLVFLIAAGILVFTTFSMMRSISNERSGSKSVLKQFGLSIALLTAFLTSWVAQALAQWEQFKSEQMEHGQAISISDFMPMFMSSTMENWQSEFLQLFAFVVLTSLLIHKGSSESKDGDEEMKQMLQSISDRLDAMEAPRGKVDLTKA